MGSITRMRLRAGCAHCGSLDFDKGVQDGLRYCRDCGAVSRNGEVLRAGYVDLHYSLDVQDDGGRSLWCETLDKLFEAQCDVAESLKIRPGSSFTKWLKSHQRVEDVIDDAGTIATMQKIVRKLLRHRSAITERYNLEAVQRLHAALPKAVRFLLTLARR